MNRYMAFISPTPCLNGPLARHAPLAVQETAPAPQPESDSNSESEPAPAPESESPATQPVAEAASEEPVADAEPVAEAEPAAEAEPVVASEAVAAATESEAEAAATASEADAEPATGDRRRRRRTRGKREVTLPLEDLKVGMELEGVVRGVMQYGAFIGGLGTPTDGLLHVSQLAAGFVENVSDVCKTGDTVKVRVLSVDVEKGTFSLTMKSAEELAGGRSEGGGGRQTRASRREEMKKKWEAFTFDPEQFIDAKVQSITDFGAFCQILNEDGTPSESTPTDGLAHISELSTSRVEKVSDVLSVGQAVKVRIIAADPDRNRLSLSLKSVPDGSEEPEERSNKGRRANPSTELDPESSSNIAADLASAEANQPVFKTAFELAFERANYSASSKQ